MALPCLRQPLPQVPPVPSGQAAARRAESRGPYYPSPKLCATTGMLTVEEAGAVAGGWKLTTCVSLASRGRVVVASCSSCASRARRKTSAPSPANSPVIIESQAIMVSTRVVIGKLNHALEVWSDGPRLPNIEPLQHEPSTADSTAIQRCIGQYSALSLCTRGVVLYCNTATIQRLHSTALQRSTLYSALQSPSA